MFFCNIHFFNVRSKFCRLQARALISSNKLLKICYILQAFPKIKIFLKSQAFCLLKELFGFNKCLFWEPQFCFIMLSFPLTATGVLSAELFALLLHLHRNKERYFFVNWHIKKLWCTRIFNI